MLKKLLVVTALTLLLGAFQCTSPATQQPVTVSASTAFPLAVEEMKRGCGDLMANKQLVDLAVATAAAALKNQGKYVTTASNWASIACSLLVPPPATPMTAPTG